MASQDTEEDTDREEYRADGLDVSSFSDGGTDRSDDVATRASSAHESDRSRVKAPSDRTVSRDITSDWVTERLARIAEISLGDRPSKVTLALVPRFSGDGPPIARDIYVFSQDGSAANQALTQLGKSWGMYKGERYVPPERPPREQRSEEYFLRMAGVCTGLAKRWAESERQKKEREHGQQTTNRSE